VELYLCSFSVNFTYEHRYILCIGMHEICCISHESFTSLSCLKLNYT
jgi:hypothetical protein